ncbi:MAG: cellulase family glycosylhydrolase [Acidobacteria bacterium]|nr:cellulase family glycosylhydrolase [Acidobacteriota bacterium]
MNRREFLNTVGGVAVASGMQASGLEAVGELLQTTPADKRRVAVLLEPGFPSIDAQPVPEPQLREALAEFDAAWLGVDALANQLTRDRFDVLVTPYGSAFPKHAWNAIRAFLAAGGHWVNLGGVPLAVPVVGGSGAWRPEVRQTAYHKSLGITQAFPITIPPAVEWEVSARHPFAAALLGQISTPSAFAFYVRFSETRQFPDEDGSDGPRDAMIEPLLAAMRIDTEAGKAVSRWPIAAPVVLIDRVRGERAGGRWVLVTSTGSVTAQLIRALTAAAAAGCQRLQVRPSLACYRDREPLVVTTELVRPGMGVEAPNDGTVAIEIVDSGGKVVANGGGLVAGRGPSIERTDTFGVFPPGMYRVDARLTRTGQSELRASSGFWVVDEAALARGTPVTADTVSLRRDGKPFPVTGTTYMASDVHRRFLLEPNPDVWDRDFAAMRRAGVNVVRTGLWTGWTSYMRDDGVTNEAALRALDAFMLTATRHDIGIVFTFFAFLPPMWGGSNAYLDPRAVAAQKRFVTAIVGRYRAMTHVTWDLINEPSFCSPDQLWLTRPNGDEHERRRWAAWLASRYPAATPDEREATIQQLWRGTVGEGLGLPEIADFTDTNLFGHRRPLKAVDYRLFAQDMFREWVDEMATAIRAAGSPGQLITVGQDEGGTGERPSNHFFGPSVDLTSIHTWWYNDDLLWDMVVSKHPAKPNLVQETGVMFYETADGRPWRSEEEVRNLFERKLALAIGVGGAGYINWIWNTNPYMPSDNEAAIGLLRPDGSIKPEFDAWRGITAFVREAAPHLEGREREQVLLVIPQANQFSVRTSAIEATKRAVRVMHYHCRVPMAAVGEFNLDTWPVPPKLAILPCPRILTRKAWAQLRVWLEQGTTLLVTGPFDEDEHWIPTGRMQEIGLPTMVRPVMPEEFVAGQAGEVGLHYRGERLHRVETVVEGPPSSVKGYREVAMGKGKLLWVAAPVELADNSEPTVTFYRLALQAAGITSVIVNTTPDDSSLLIYPASYRDAVLYTIVSETRREPQRVSFCDPSERPCVSISFGAGRAALVLVDRRTHAVIADYPHGSAARSLQP